MGIKNEHELDQMLRSFYGATSPKEFSYDNIEKNKEFKRRKPLIAACAIISVFIIFTAFYLGMENIKKGSNDKDTDKGTEYPNLCFGPFPFYHLFNFLNYTTLSNSKFDNENLLMPQLPVPCENIITEVILYNNYRYRYICIANINGKRFAMKVRFEELEVKEGKEWYNLYKKYGEVSIREYNGEKYIKSIGYAGYTFYKNGVVIECSFMESAKDLLPSEILEVAANTTFVKPVFTAKNTVKLMYKEIEDKKLITSETKKILKYNYTEIDLSKGYITKVYSDKEKYYYVDEKTDEVIGYELITIKNLQQTTCEDTKLAAEEYLRNKTDVDMSKYMLTESNVIDGKYKYTYIEFVNGYKTTNQIIVVVDQYGNILSYIRHEQPLPESWSELRINMTSLRGDARGYASSFLSDNNSAKYKTFILEDYKIEDFYPVISTYGKEMIIIKIKAVWSNEVEKNIEEIMYFQVPL